jgi:hypothetical protein
MLLLLLKLKYFSHGNPSASLIIGTLLFELESFVDEFLEITVGYL